MKTIAITGVTGQFGAIVLAKLLEKSTANIIALARDPSKIRNVEARKFDYSKSEGQVEALHGVDTLLLVSGNEIGQRAIQHKNVIESAQKAGVKHIIYTSLLYADTSILNLAGEHVETEQALKASGIDYTILRNGWYTENYTASIQPALALNAFYGSAKEGEIASATRADLAEAAVKVLISGGHEGKTYELAGDNAYTLSELAAEISKQTGKDIPYVDIPEAEYANALKQAGLPEELAECLASWDVVASQGALFSEDKTLSTLLGRPTTSLADAVNAALS
ncbi:SDR family oxidoreductase [Mannheimia granulomatis]|uniref:SDR family oxidoreductase n=1 Tax=Mannheimia granulomatis TaxID=85402 RepID=UPI0005197494|nr:SDR family oxidoreductase [Mannheimia granulomatis]QLB18145.1 NAD(P)-dependent oxidoreductase [Mannheimia granulomatis]